MFCGLPNSLFLGNLEQNRELRFSLWPLSIPELGPLCASPQFLEDFARVTCLTDFWWRGLISAPKQVRGVLARWEKWGLK